MTLASSALFGIGLGFCMQPMVLAVQNAVPPQDMGVATSSATFFRQMGGTLGTAVFLSILFSTVGDRITSAFRSDAGTAPFQAALKDPQVLADPVNRRVVDAVTGGGGLPKGALDDTSFLSQLDDRLARPFLQGFSSAIDLVFSLGGGGARGRVRPHPVPAGGEAAHDVGHRGQAPAGRRECRSAGGRAVAAATTRPAAAVSAPSSQMVDGVTVDEAVHDAADVGGVRR